MYWGLGPDPCQVRNLSMHSSYCPSSPRLTSGHVICWSPIPGSPHHIASCRRCCVCCTGNDDEPPSLHVRRRGDRQSLHGPPLEPFMLNAIIPLWPWLNLVLNTAWGGAGEVFLRRVGLQLFSILSIQLLYYDSSHRRQWFKCMICSLWQWWALSTCESRPNYV